MSSAHFLWDFILSFSLLELSVQTGEIRSLSVVYFSNLSFLFVFDIAYDHFFLPTKGVFLIFKICYKTYQSFIYLFSFASGF